MYRQLGEDTLDSPKWGVMGAGSYRLAWYPKERTHTLTSNHIQFLFIHLQGLPCIQLYASSAVPPAFATMHNWSSLVLPSPNYS